MGQYYKVVNLDKKEYLHPHELGVGLKIWEQIASWPGTTVGLFLLLTNHPEPRGGGDLPEREEAPELYEVLGRWVGDRVVIIGDYAERDDLPPEYEADVLYECCQEEEDFMRTLIHYFDSDRKKADRMMQLSRFRNITPLVRTAISKALWELGEYVCENGYWRWKSKKGGDDG